MLALAVALVLPDLTKLLDVSQNAVGLFEITASDEGSFLSIACA